MTEDLQNNPLFSGLDDEGLKQIERIAQRRNIKKGEGLFFQGEEARGFFMVLRGRIKVFRLSTQGQEYVMRVAGPGETLAEAAVFSGKSYPASAEALEDSQLYYFIKSDFIQLIRREPQLALNMMSGLSLLLRHLAQQVEDLSLKEVSSRLARYILDQARNGSAPLAAGLQVPLAMKKNLLASRLGTIGETLSRTLAKMKQREVIEIIKDVVVIRNPELLKEIAGGAKL
ncbi:MAG: Crp/Fnr family transcriptional regulator [Desulfobacterota bacterium]|nr:Crp/Fnr family transcriptional regulator [Thermodesulfobacteriota bacterium]